MWCVRPWRLRPEEARKLPPDPSQRGRSHGSAAPGATRPVTNGPHGRRGFVCCPPTGSWDGGLRWIPFAANLMATSPSGATPKWNAEAPVLAPLGNALALELGTRARRPARTRAGSARSTSRPRPQGRSSGGPQGSRTHEKPALRRVERPRVSCITPPNCLGQTTAPQLHWIDTKCSHPCTVRMRWRVPDCASSTHQRRQQSLRNRNSSIDRSPSIAPRPPYLLPGHCDSLRRLEIETHHLADSLTPAQI